MEQRHRWYIRGGMAAVLVVGASIASGASQRAHVHGVGHINIVVEGKQATVEFLAPAEGLYGFEHQAVRFHVEFLHFVYTGGGRKIAGLANRTCDERLSSSHHVKMSGWTDIARAPAATAIGAVEHG